MPRKKLLCSNCHRRRPYKDGLCSRCWFRQWRKDIRGGRDPRDCNPWSGF